MSHKLMQMQRADTAPPPVRPVMLGIAGDSAAGKTTLTGGLVKALGADTQHLPLRGRLPPVRPGGTSVLPFTPLHPDCNYVEIMEQHLQLLATGKPVLKPVYDHSDGTAHPARTARAEGIRHRRGSAAAVHQAGQGMLRRHGLPRPARGHPARWKITRDTTKRGYTEEQVRAEMQRREPESERFIRSQRSNADIVIVFSPIEGRDDPPDTPLSANSCSGRPSRTRRSPRSSRRLRARPCTSS